jgi:hypothetical protein
MLKQNGMRAGAGKGNFFAIGHVIHNPITLNMALSKTFQIAVKFMFPASGGQRFFPDKVYYNIKDFIQIFAAFFQQIEIFLEFIIKGIVKHRSVFQQILFSLFEFVRFIPFYRDIATHNGFGFFKSSQCLGVKTRVSCYRVAVLGADGTFPVNADIKRCFFRQNSTQCKLLFNNITLKEGFGKFISREKVTDTV